MLYTKSEPRYTNQDMNRRREFEILKKIISRKKSDFFYVRGRRRVGKSWILSELSKSTANVFYFMASRDARDEQNKVLFAEKWALFSKNSHLTELSKQALTWNRIFDEVTKFAKNNKNNITLIFDEIQWLAKTGAGFCGLLKERWLEWEKLANIKIIICGSSSRFFMEQTGGEEQLLRGMKTHSDIWILPFSLPEVHQQCFPHWNHQEVALLYMMIGGIPYYIQQIDTEKSFIHAINQAFFLKGSIFLEEVDEVLRIEFNKSAVITCKNILKQLGYFGTTQLSIIEKSKLPKSTVSETIEKLLDYNLLFSKYPMHIENKKKNVGNVYYMKDLFLLFYFQILDPLKERIQSNEKSLLFPYEVLASKSNYYVPNFSGYAFELLLKTALEHGPEKYPTLYDKLELTDKNFEMGEFWDSRTQIDLIIEHRKDRLARVIEVKWLDSKNLDLKSVCQNLNEKKYPLPEKFSRQNYLLVSFKPTQRQTQTCKKLNVKLISLDDFFLS